jgi:hypothetical protein
VAAVRPIHPPVRPARARRSVLTVQPLEGRLAPAGLVLATLSPTGVLTLTGDEDDNGLAIKVTGGTVVLTPDAGTAVNAGSPGSVVPLNGVPVTSIKIDLKGGADTLSLDTSDPNATFAVPGVVSINLGDGNNILDLTTGGQITLGGLTVKGGDGTDTVTVNGAAGSRVTGAASFGYADGGSTTTLTNLSFGVGVKLTALDGVSVPNTVAATNVTVAKGFTAALGNSNGALASFAGGTLGGLNVSGATVGAVLVGTTVKGNVTVKGLFQADLQVDGATVTGNVTLTSALPSLEATGAGTSITGNLSLTGTAWTSAVFATTTLTQVGGNVMVKGGWYSDLFQTNGMFRAAKNLTLILGGGDNTVSLGDGSAAVSVVGNLMVTAAGGADTVSLDWLAVTGTTTVKTLSGADMLSVEDGSSFAKAFTADLGTGDDTISVAQVTGSTAAVAFSSPAKITAGTGNDILMLGLGTDPLVGGDANTRAVFLAPVNVVDGGFGLDLYDASSGQSNGATPTGWEF